MIGSIVTLAGKQFVVLDASHTIYAVAPLVSRRDKTHAYDVPAVNSVVRCGNVRLVRNVTPCAGSTLDADTIAACRKAAARAASERGVNRFNATPAFSQAQDKYRSGGRRVGAHGIA